MPSEPSGHRAAQPWRIRTWPIWEIPRQVLMTVLTVELTAIGLVVASAVVGSSVTVVAWRDAAILVLLGMLHAEFAAGIERTRRRLITGGTHVGLNSVWTFAGAVVLPPVLAVGLAVVLQTHKWLRTGRPRVPLYRNLFSTATVVLACLAAGVVVGEMQGALAAARWDGISLLVVLLAVGAYTTVNSALVAAAIALSAPQPNLTMVLGHWDDNALEIATLCLGALVAVALGINPWLVLLVLPPLLVLHRAVLVRQLEEAASTDGKTGLLNAATWHVRAENELRRAARRPGPRAVLVLDLDHFKEVNDTHGHLVGDQVLAAVAETLRSEVRDRDLVGRFGGEEFVVLLTGLAGGSESDLEAVADRIRRRVEGMRVEIPTADGPLTVAGLSVSVGGAIHTGGRADLSALMRVADTALYSAKRAGRNRVRMGLAMPETPTSITVTRPAGGASEAG